MVDRRGRARSFRRVASPGVEVETAGSAAVKIIIIVVLETIGSRGPDPP